MTRATFFQHFDLLAGQPNAVARLRELVLRLAVEGRLIPQDPKDKPAIDLVERSAVEHKRLVKERTAKAYAPPPVESGEKFIRSTPTGWEWVRLKQLGYFCVGATPSMNNSAYWGKGISWVTPKDMRASRIQGSEMSVTPLALKETRLRLLPKKAVLIVGRSGILKRLLPVAVTDIECVVNQDMKVLVPFLPELASFIQLMLRGHQAFILEKLVKGGMTVQSLKYDEFEAQPFPLPPVAEQRRIVAKVEELLALCDELEARQHAAHERRADLIHSALEHLATAQDPADFRQRSNFILHHSSFILEAVPALRQTILSLAVQGRLVPQNPKDEPAETLIRRVCATKQRIAKANGEKPPKIWPKVEPDELEQDFPAVWAVARLGDVAINIEAGCSPQCEGRRRTNDEWGILKISAVSWDEFDPEENKALPPHIKPRPEFEVQDDDFLMSRANTAELVAKSVVARKPPPRLLLNDKTLRVHFTEHTDKQFINLVNNSLRSRVYYAKASSGTSNSMKNITREAIAMLPVAIPPLAEQRRIVAKVSELLALCDALEARQTAARDLGATLLDSTLHRLLAT